MNGGVYQINIGKYFYIGSSYDLNKRKAVHLRDLRKGKHHNIRLLRTFQKHPDKFEFFVLAFAPIEDIRSLEQKYLDIHFGMRNCMNLSHNAESAFTTEENKIKTSQRNKTMIWTKEMREKASRAKIGKKHTQEVRLKLSLTRKGDLNSNLKINSSLYPEIAKMRKSGALIEEIAQKYNVHDTTINKILRILGITVKDLPRRGWTLKQRQAIKFAKAKSKAARMCAMRP